jgi:Fe-S-cluster containining protein
MLVLLLYVIPVSILIIVTLQIWKDAQHLTRLLKNLKNIFMTKKQELCKECQKCCKRIGIYTRYRDVDADAINFFKIRGFDVFFDDMGFVKLELNLPCPHLTNTGCDIYNARPVVCAEYDGRKDYGEECLWTTIE